MTTGMLRITGFRPEQIRFGAVGIYNTVVGYAVFAGLLALVPRLHYLGSLAVTHVVSVLNGYLAHRWLVFRVRGQVLVDLARFWSVQLAALGVNAVILAALVEGAGLGPLPAELLAVVATVLFSWFGHSRFSFRRPPAAGV